MTRHTLADADRPSWRTRERRRAADLAFIAWLRTATRAELEAMLPHVWGWRAVAVRRRMRG